MPGAPQEVLGFAPQPQAPLTAPYTGRETYWDNRNRGVAKPPPHGFGPGTPGLAPVPAPVMPKPPVKLPPLIDPWPLGLPHWTSQEEVRAVLARRAADEAADAAELAQRRAVDAAQAAAAAAAEAVAAEPAEAEAAEAAAPANVPGHDRDPVMGLVPGTRVPRPAPALRGPRRGGGGPVDARDKDPAPATSVMAREGSRSWLPPLLGRLASCGGPELPDQSPGCGAVAQRSRCTWLRRWPPHDRVPWCVTAKTPSKSCLRYLLVLCVYGLMLYSMRSLFQGREDRSWPGEPHLRGFRPGVLPLLVHPRPAPVLAPANGHGRWGERGPG